MSLRVSPFRFLVASGLALMGGRQAIAQIAAKSPFLPPHTANAPGPASSAPLQFAGYMKTNEGVQYRLYAPAKKVSFWVKLNERNADFDVLAKQHDDGQQTLTIEYQGKTLTLAERQSKVVSSGSAAMPPPVAMPVQTNVPPAVTQAVVLNPTPADEQRRLDAVAAEVARRRALREQAAQGGSQPQTTLPQPVQAQGQPTRVPWQQPQNAAPAQGPVAPQPIGR